MMLYIEGKLTRQAMIKDRIGSKKIRMEFGESLKHDVTEAGFEDALMGKTSRY